MVEESGVRTHVINKINVRKLFAFDLKRSCVSAGVLHYTSCIPVEYYESQHMCEKSCPDLPITWRKGDEKIMTRGGFEPPQVYTYEKPANAGKLVA